MNVLVTGSNGVIGTVLRDNLAHDIDITSFDLPDFDARDYRQLLEEAKGQDAIVHLA